MAVALPAITNLITNTQIQAVVCCSRKEGHMKLRDIFGYEPFDEEDDVRISVYIDYLYEVVKFTAEKGFAWQQVISALRFADDLLRFSLRKNITEAVRFIEAKSHILLARFGDRNCKIFVDYVYSTFMPHYQLFQFVFTKSREEQRPQVQVVIEIPVLPLLLSTGVRANIWEYEKNLEKIEKAAKEKTEERQHHLQQIAETNKQNKLRASLQIESMACPITRESLQEMLRDVLDSYTKETESNLTFAIKEMEDDLDYKFQVTAVPRPEDLGPPPRFTLKTKPLPQSAGKEIGKTELMAGSHSARPSVR